MRLTGFALGMGLAGSLAFSAPAFASTTVNYGSTSPTLTSDCTPGCTPTMQTVYSHTLFGSSPVTISAIDFFLSGSTSQNYSITLSTSANPVGSLSYNYASNVGGDAALFYSGVPAVSGFGAWRSFGGSFLYDPSMGDLLVQITHSGSDVLNSSYEGSTADAQRVYDFGSGSTTGYVNTPGYAIATRFTLGAAVGAVPEPSTWAMMLLGFGAIGLASRRNRRRQLARA